MYSKNDINYRAILAELNRIEITNSGKLKFHSTILEKFKLQKYLTFPINPKERNTHS
jgi:hypothetical protein